MKQIQYLNRFTVKISLLLLVSIFVFGLTCSKAQSKKEPAKYEHPIEITDNIKKIKDEGWGYRYYLKEPQVIKTYPIKKSIMISRHDKKMIWLKTMLLVEIPYPREVN